jgi:hypothetical protein
MERRRARGATTRRRTRAGIGTERRRGGSTTDRAGTGLFRYGGHTYTFGELSALRGGAAFTDYVRVSEELQRLTEKHRVDSEHPEAADQAADLDRQSFARWLDSLNLAPEARFVADQANISLYDAELRDVSVLFVAQQTAATTSARTWSQFQRRHCATSISTRRFRRLSPTRLPGSASERPRRS